MNGSYSAGCRLGWRLGTFTAGRLLSLSARVRLRRYAELPAGGFILAANHISHFDPALWSCFFPRPIDWIAMNELLSGPLLRGMFRSFSVIPVDRHGGDRTSVRQAAKRLDLGRVVGIFPEGGIRDGAASIVNGAPMKGGAAMLGALTGKPIVPGVILGSDRLYNHRHWRPWRKAPVWLGLGAPLSADPSLPPGARRRQLAQDLAKAFPQLRDRLCADFALTPQDLPHSPQQRLAER